MTAELRATSKHIRWPEPTGASTRRMRALRARREAAAKAAKKAKKRAYNQAWAARHPTWAQDKKAAQLLEAQKAARCSNRYWFAEELSEKAALAFVMESVVPSQKEVAAKYLDQVRAACKAAGLAVNKFTLTRGGVESARAQRRRAYDFHAKGFTLGQAVQQAITGAPSGYKSPLEAMFADEAIRIFGDGQVARLEFDS